MATRAIIRNRSVEGEFINTSRNFGFKKSAALNQWNWGPRLTATGCGYRAPEGVPCEGNPHRH